MIRFGEPAEIIVPRCAGEEDFRVGVEVWKYVNPPLGLNRRHFLFFRPQGSGPRRLWTLLEGDGLTLFYPNSCRQKLDDLKWDCVPKPFVPREIRARCAPIAATSTSRTVRRRCAK